MFLRREVAQIQKGYSLFTFNIQTEQKTLNTKQVQKKRLFKQRLQNGGQEVQG